MGAKAASDWPLVRIRALLRGGRGRIAQNHDLSRLKSKSASYTEIVLPAEHAAGCSAGLRKLATDVLRAQQL